MKIDDFCHLNKINQWPNTRIFSFVSIQTNVREKNNKQAEMLVSTLLFHVHVNSINKFISNKICRLSLIVKKKKYKNTKTNYIIQEFIQENRFSFVIKRLCKWRYIKKYKTNKQKQILSIFVLLFVVYVFFSFVV